MWIVAIALAQSSAAASWPDARQCTDGAISGPQLVQHLLTGELPNTPRYMIELGGPSHLDRLRDSSRHSGAARCSGLTTVALANQCRADTATAQAILMIAASVNRASSANMYLERTDSGQLPQIRLEEPGSDAAYLEQARTLFEEPSRFRVVCANVSDQSDPAQPRQAGTPQADLPEPRFRRSAGAFIIGGDRKALTTRERADREFATFAFESNIRENTDTWNLNGVIGYNFRWHSTGRTLPRTDRIDLTPFLSVRRRGGNLSSATSELNEFSAGSAFGFRHVTNSSWNSGVHIVSGDARYITDDSLDARALALSVRYELPFGHIRSFGSYADIYGTRFQFRWSVDVLADGVWIDNPGDTFPAGLSDWRRLGADAGIATRYVNSDWLVIPELSLSYSVREDFSSSTDASASMFTGALALVPRKESRVSVSLRYETGEDLIKLSDQQVWTLSFGFRY